MPKLDISFKQTTKDMKLYSEVMAKEERSQFIKDCIEFWILNNKEVGGSVNENR